MIRQGDSIRRALSGALAVLALGLNVAMPLLERGGIEGLGVESHHDPSRCSAGHDHRLCAQVGANLSVAPIESDHLPSDFVVDLAPPSGRAFAPGASALTGPPPRAPPSA